MHKAWEREAAPAAARLNCRQWLHNFACGYALAPRLKIRNRTFVASRTARKVTQPELVVGSLQRKGQVRTTRGQIHR